MFYISVNDHPFTKNFELVPFTWTLVAMLTFYHTCWFINLNWTGEYPPKDRRVLSIMIELNRKLYMDEESGEKLERFGEFKRLVCAYIKCFLPNYGK